METNLHRFGRILLVLAAVILPVLAGYVIYEQTRAPVFDATLDWSSGKVLSIEQDSFANWAGFQPGDVIVSVDGMPFPHWPNVVGNYMAEVRRGGETIQLEMPLVPMARVNREALLGGVAVALVFWASGLLLLLRRSERTEIRLLFLLSQAFAVALLFPLAYSPKWSPPAWGLGLSVASLFVSAPLLLHYYLSFPVRLGTTSQRQWILIPLYMIAFALGLLWWMDSALGRQVGMIFTVCVVVAALGVQGYSYFRRASPDDRRRLRLIFFGSLLGASPALLFFFLPSIFHTQRIPLWLAGLFTVAAPLSYHYAVLRHNLFGIDRLLNRTLVYAALSLGILILYLGPFLLIYRFAPDDWLAQTMVASGLTLGVGLAFERTRTTLQRSVDRLFYGGWYDYPGVVEQVTRALAGCTNRAQLSDALARQTPALMQLQGCALTFDEPKENSAPVRVHPRSPRPEFALSFQGQPRALWTIGPHRDGDDLTDSDRRILDTLARQAEIALGNILLIETLRAQLDEIRASREALTQAQHRLLRSREDERARLARDLHDGPLQVLIGLNMQLGLLLPQANGLEGLAEMRAEVRDLLDELRGVCSELRPPMLDTLGLAAAIRGLAEEWSAQNHVEACLNLPPNATFPSLPGDVSVNLYRVAQEALTNIAKHAQARRVDIRLVAEGDGLSMTIADDGRGFALPGEMDALIAEGHFGLVGLRERVNLIGGTLRLQSAPGQGTRLRVEWRPPSR
jgi:signal transduction histidine kinase